MKNKGITLIALVITIIILIILAGVVINLGLGKNGILKKAQKAKEQYKISQIKEKVELEIINMEMNRIDSTKLTIGEVLQELIRNKTFESMDIEESLGYTEGYEVKLKYDENESVIVEYVKKASGKVTISYKLEPESYTKTSEVNIVFIAKGNVKSVTKPDGLVVYPQNGIIAIDYKVTANGKYLFKVENNEGEITQKEVIVETIDTLKPKDFQITAENTGAGFKMTANAEDTEETRDENGNLISAKSGIGKIEYYVKLQSQADTAYKKYETNEITGLTQGTYNIYAIAYDKAENEKQIEPITAKVTLKFSKVSINEEHSLGIDIDGNLWAWGRNNYGQLGNGTKTDSKVPIQIKSGTKFKEIVASWQHSLAIDEEGNLWTWGNNDYGKLGNGTTTHSSVPIQIKPETKFKEISSKSGHNMAIDIEGNLWTWGNNTYGVLGNGVGGTIEKKPIQIKPGIKFKKIAAGIEHSMAIDEEGNAYTWGHNINGELGNGGGEPKEPTKIKEETKFKEISAGNRYSMAIDSEGNLWAWGNNGIGQLGIGYTWNNSHASPIKVKEGTKFKKISAGYQHSMAIDEEGNLWTWGDGGNGRLGYETSSSYTPMKVKEETKFKEISAGRQTSMVIDIESNLLGCGYNNYGQLGNRETNVYSFVQVP